MVTTNFMCEQRFSLRTQSYADLWYNSQLFYWIWPPVIQTELDQYRNSWNNHTVRSQKNKQMPSGSTPQNFLTLPENYGGQYCAIPVDRAFIQQLRERIPVSREEAMRWVSDEFAALAGDVYDEIGSPVISLTTAWTVFQQMEPLLRAQMDTM